MADNDNAELTGTIESVASQSRDDKIKKFSVKGSESGTIYKCECPFFCPVQKGDVIYAVVKILKNETLRIILPPYVEPTANKEDTIKCFITMGKMGYVSARKLYDNIKNRCQNTKAETEESIDDNVVMYISKLSENWRNSHEETILDKLVGMDKDKAKIFLSRWFKQRNLRRLYLLGMTKSEITACELSTDEIFERCKENPLTLYGISIMKAIEIMGRLNREPTPEQIMCGKILRYVHENNTKRGWMGTPTKIMMKTYPDFPKYKDQLEKEYYMIAELHTVYIYKHAYDEHRAARYINELMKDNREIIDHPYFACGKDDVILSEKQKKAVRMALSTGISVITGAAGTGKTTIISSIIQNLELLGKKFLLCAPTGKAADVIRRTSGRSATTIHRLISNICNYVDADHGVSMIIIDESSMLTVTLFCQLMSVIDFPNVPLPKIVFVGDVNQLPPIEAGTLMYEVLKVKEIPATFLTHNMRVTETKGVNGILTNLEKILSMSESDKGCDSKTFKGKKWGKAVEEENVGIGDEEYFESDYDPFDDFDPDDIPNLPAFNPPECDGEFDEYDNFFITLGDIDLIYDIIIDHHKNGGDQNDLTVISPYNRDLKKLNEKFQQIYHSEDPSTKDHWGTVWHSGDRIMCLENNTEYGLSNGEEGIVDDFDDKVLKLRFNNYRVTNNKVIPIEKIIKIPLFPKMKNRRITNVETGDEDSIDEFTSQKFTASYAITVHKAQGSQYDKGVFYLPPDYKAGTFVNRNMIYTALSRFKSVIHIIGNIYTFQNSINIPLPYRHDCLAKRIDMVKSGKSATSKAHDNNFFIRNVEGIVVQDNSKKY